jgi:hypothetical protein
MVLPAMALTTGTLAVRLAERDSDPDHTSRTTGRAPL